MIIRRIKAIVCAAAIATAALNGTGAALAADISSADENVVVMNEEETGRSSVNFNAGWRYYRGTPEGDPVSDGFDDSIWRIVSLPHSMDYVTDDNMLAYIGEAWYRKRFTIPAEYSGKKIYINFGAAMQSAEVYINGELIGTHQGGFMGFVFDITDHVKIGAENIIAVKINTKADSNWMPASSSVDFQYHGGLYRSVSLEFTDPVHITDPLFEDITGGGGIFIHSDTADDYSEADESMGISNIQKNYKNGIAVDFTGDVEFTAKVNVRNDESTEKSVYVENELYSPDGDMAWSNIASEQTIAVGATADFIATGNLIGAKLWHPYSPNRYTLITKVYVDGECVDSRETKTGFRKIEFTAVDKESGTKGKLLINDEPFEGLGTDTHQEIGMVGFAVPEAAARDEARMIKEAGFDYVRLAHYPYQTAFLDACDEYGLLVQAPVTGWQKVGNSAAQEFSYNEARELIRRDRNHPSIALWELCINEAGISAEFSSNMAALAKEEFPTKQMITTGGTTKDHMSYDVAYVHSNNDISQDGVPNVYYEYGDWQYGGGMSTTRRVRWDKRESVLRQATANFQTGLDRAQASLANFASYWVWQDYSGFGSADGSSAYNMTGCGIVDYQRTPKYAYYYAQSQRDPALEFTGLDDIQQGAMIYIANRWFDNSATDVPVYTNCDSVKLYADNDFSTPIAEMNEPDKNKSKENDGSSYELVTPYKATKHPPFTFTGISREYRTLTAVGYIDGEEAARYSVTDPSRTEASRLDISWQAENDVIPLTADGGDKRLMYIRLKDADGNLISNAGTAMANDDFGVPLDDEGGRKITVTINGDGWLLGGDKLNSTMKKSVAVTTRGGCAAVWVCAGKTAGDEISVTAECDGIVSNELKIETVAAEGYDAAMQPSDSADSDYCLARTGKISASSGSPEKAADADNETSWQSATGKAGEYVLVDAGDIYDISDIDILWGGTSAYKYRVMYSDDMLHWKNLIDRSDNEAADSETSEVFTGKSGRYIKLIFTDDSSEKFEIKELHVNGELASAAAEVNAADNKTAVWVSGGNNAQCGIDGDPATYATADNKGAGNVWAVDLGGYYDVKYLDIRWEKQHSYKYTIEVSADNESWTKIIDKSGNAEAEEESIIQLDEPYFARYMRIISASDTEPLSFSMFKVFATESEDFAAGCEVTTDSSPVSGHREYLAVDGDDATYWQPDGEGRYIDIALNGCDYIEGVRVVWADGGEHSYTIMYSSDGNSWYEAASGTDLVQNVKIIKASYVRFINNSSAGTASVSLYGSGVIPAKDLGRGGVIKTSDGLPQQMEVDGIMQTVKWKSSIKELEEYEPVMVYGETEGGEYVCAEFEIIPDGLMYFADCNNNDTVLNEYKAVSDTIINTVPDKRFEDDSQDKGEWGIVSNTSEYGGASSALVSEGDKYRTGYWTNGKMSYSFKLSAGCYRVTASFYEFWVGNSGRTINVSITDENGKNIGSDQAELNGKYADGTTTMIREQDKTDVYIDLDSEQLVTVTISKISGNNPNLSWIAIAETDETKIKPEYWNHIEDGLNGSENDNAVVLYKFSNDSDGGMHSYDGEVLTISDDGSGVNACYAVTAVINNIEPNTVYEISFKEKTEIKSISNPNHGFYLNADTRLGVSGSADISKMTTAENRKSGTFAKVHQSEVSDGDWEKQSFTWTSGSGLKDGYDTYAAFFHFTMRSMTGSISIKDIVIKKQGTDIPVITNPVTNNGVLKSAIITLPDNEKRAMVYAVSRNSEGELTGIKAVETDGGKCLIDVPVGDSGLTLMVWNEEQKPLCEAMKL